MVTPSHCDSVHAIIPHAHETPSPESFKPVSSVSKLLRGRKSHAIRCGRGFVKGRWTYRRLGVRGRALRALQDYLFGWP